MFSILTKLSAASPTPAPRILNAETVHPGPLAAVVFTLLLISLILLLISMTRHIKRIDVNRHTESK